MSDRRRRLWSESATPGEIVADLRTVAIWETRSDAPPRDLGREYQRQLDEAMFGEHRDVVRSATTQIARPLGGDHYSLGRLAIQLVFEIREPGDPLYGRCDQTDDGYVICVRISPRSASEPHESIATLIHELGHVLEPQARHGRPWRRAVAEICERLGLRSRTILAETRHQEAVDALLLWMVRRDPRWRDL